MTAWLSGDTLAARTVSFVLGVLLLALAVRALKTGSAQLVYRPISRKDDAVMYWVAVLISGLGGVFLVLGAVFPSLVGR